MDKVKLEGGNYDGLTLQAKVLPENAIYVGGNLYAWSGKVIQGKYRAFQHVPVLATTDVVVVDDIEKKMDG